MINAADVAVIGGGPAGAVAAYIAANSGAATILLEQQPLPRVKLCGGVLTLAALCALPYPLPPALTRQTLTRARIVCGPYQQVTSNGAPFAISIERSVFDHYLLQHAQAAGAKILAATKAWDVTRQDGRVIVATDGGHISAKVVIAADGAYSRVGQKINGWQILKRCGICLQGEIPWSTLPGNNILPDGLNIYYGLTHCGYGWVIPGGSTARIGLGGLVHPSWQPRTAYVTFLRHLGCPPPLTVQSARIPASPARRLVSDGLLLAGDAAGWVDPLTGEGLRYAILSGRLAGEAALTAIKSGRPVTADRLAPYIDACQAAFGRDLACAAVLARLFGHCPAAIHRALMRQQEIFQRILNILTGTGSYRQTLAWLLPRLPWYVLKGIRYEG